jgi:hypothetical protein
MNVMSLPVDFNSQLACVVNIWIHRYGEVAWFKGTRTIAGQGGGVVRRRQFPDAVVVEEDDGAISNDYGTVVRWRRFNRNAWGLLYDERGGIEDSNERIGIYHGSNCCVNGIILGRQDRWTTPPRIDGIRVISLWGIIYPLSM